MTWGTISVDMGNAAALKAKMSSVDKGNELEDRFYEYLLDQKNRRQHVFGAYPAELCKIYKKKKYFCKERESDVEFDIVIEVIRESAKEPHLVVVFECKNHSGNIPESHVIEFSDKLGRIFKHNAKGVMVVSSPLQAGAQKVLENRKIGLAKYNETGFEIQIERVAEDSFVRKGIFESINRNKPLKFSAYYERNFFSSVKELFQAFDEDDTKKDIKTHNSFSVPYIPQEDIKKSTAKLLEIVNYQGGRVDLESICSTLKIDLHYYNRRRCDENGREILGLASFSERKIQLNLHENKHRERFTLGHEIGHFYLQHDKFLQSETLIEEDLLKGDVNKDAFNYERLEAQANNFSSYLLLPEDYFLAKTAKLRKELGIQDRGHGYIYVDDQPCNFSAYNSLVSGLSLHFGASKNAIEVKFKKMGMLTDNRK